LATESERTPLLRDNSGSSDEGLPPLTPPVDIENDLRNLGDQDEMLNSQTFDGVSNLSGSFQARDQQSTNPSMSNYANFDEESVTSQQTTEVKEPFSP
jgi:hypothetical protein